MTSRMRTCQNGSEKSMATCSDIDQPRLLLATVILFAMVPNVWSTCPNRPKIILNGISRYDMEMILNLHNRMRQAVATGQIYGLPPASNMMEMKWDQNLANRAQFWASSCSPLTHDSNRDLPSYPVGQNIASTWTTEMPQSYEDIRADFAGIISKWLAEKNKYRFGATRPTSLGHYTQMIWAETDSIGCGYSLLLDPVRGFTKNYVCNYGPSGNVIGELPYVQGPSHCHGSDKSQKYPGLCVKTASGHFYQDDYFLQHYQ